MSLISRVFKNKTYEPAPPSFIYTPLSPNKAEIRVLRLEPCNDLHGKPICSLEVVSLDSNPAYEALSYAWGDPKNKRPIQLQDRPWSVTENLDAALRYLRNRDGSEEAVLLWVDALCIDQSNSTEQEHQVQLMRRVYSEAAGVRIWLGEADEGSELALSLLGQFTQDRRGCSISELEFGPGQSTARGFYHGRRFIGVGSTVERRRIKCLIDLLGRPWWLRLWTVQEVVLARTVTMHCGTFSLNMDPLLDAAGCPTIEMSDLEAFGLSSNTLELFLQRFNRLLDLSDLHQAYRNGLRYSFLKVLLRGQFHQCSKQQDTIYGLLGLATAELAARIIPDYALPLSAILVDAAIQIMDCDQSLDALSYSEHVPFDARIVPTWVPQWRTRREGRETRIRIDSGYPMKNIFLFDACKSEALLYEVTAASTLRVHGLPLGSISQVALQLKDKHHTYLGPHYMETILGSLRYGKDDIKKELSSQTSEHEIGLHRYPAWRFFIGDVVHEYATKTSRRCCEEDWTRFRYYIDAGKGEPETQLAKPYIFDFYYASIGRRPFRIADSDLIGLGPAAMRRGDVVYIIKGGKVPFVLRPVANAAKPNSFELVGDCFVGGVMDGEAVEEELWRDIFLV